jgi:hypothetical protein
MGEQLNSEATAVEVDEVLRHDIPDEAIEAATSVNARPAFTLAFCTMAWDCSYPL